MLKVIKKYLNLSDAEKKIVKDFINRKENSKKSIEEIEKMFNNKMYGYGKGALFYFIEGQVLGKINVVLEVVEELGNIFIHCLEVLEDLDTATKEKIIKELIDKTIEVSEEYNPKEILLGERNKDRLKLLEKLNLHSRYKAVKMYLEDRENKENCLNLISLSEKNKVEYWGAYNDSFNDMPHGSYIYINEVEEYLRKANNENYYFMVSTDNTTIGFMNCVIENGQGIFDIGLRKAYRGKGYGKRLLETAIDFLNEKKVYKINLIVIEKNQIAYNMYKKRGFKEESVISYWIKIK